MLTRDHTVLPAIHTFIHKWYEPYLPLLLSRRASPPFGWHSLYHPTEDRRLSRPKLLNFMKIYQELFRYRHWRRQLWDTGAHVPLTSNNLFFAVHFTAVQSLTAALCGCLSKHICILPIAAAEVHSWLHKPCFVYYSASFFVRQKVSCSFVCPSHQILATLPAIVLTDRQTDRQMAVKTEPRQKWRK